ncbi:hypothetical protein CFOL_v3_03849 [Cephalotus follicularis]|uniref:Uncharacterized protein n=1 Tax=Cephalotus follicularis TaxID=3775 RepID=A0A1Q3AX77_CEPFO|nr:hypothetical protein CFOL_v3_03849 [Cephalotus follicularis]
MQVQDDVKSLFKHSHKLLESSSFMPSCASQIAKRALDNETSNGWPLGLQIMNTRLRVVESTQDAPSVELPYSLHMPTSSFSSFSSSNLDTESTASFFQDHSVSLGLLIGLRPVDRGGLYFPNTIRIEEHDDQGISAIRGACASVSRGRGVDMSQGICIPLLVGALDKMTRTRSKSNGNA